jgi:hypothetical protein
MVRRSYISSLLIEPLLFRCSTLLKGNAADAIARLKQPDVDV